ncbi:MAG: NAD(P)-dependent oxidoreductase [Trueperaceae bacterium]
MKTLITGAAGFVGLNLTEALLRRGDDVVVLDARPELPTDATDAFADLPGTLTYVRGDVLDTDALEATVRDHDVTRFVHAAVITPGPDREVRDWKTIVDVNYRGTIEALDVAVRCGVERFLYPSSASVYGDTSFDDPTLKEDVTHPVPNAFYGIAKYAAERSTLRAHDLLGLDARVARVGAVFGPWEHATGLRDTLSGPMLASRLAVQGEEVVLPRPGPRDWVYARDVAGALIALLDAENPPHRLYNVSSGVRWTMQDWCERMQAHDPDFRWRISDDPSEANVTFGPRDRSPLDVERLTGEIYQPRYPLAEAFDDYMAWIDQRTDFWTRS